MMKFFLIRGKVNNLIFMPINNHIKFKEMFIMQEYRSKEIYGDFYENEDKPLVVLIGGSRPGLPAPLSEDLLNYF